MRNSKKNVTTADMLEILGIGRTTLYRYIERGILLPPDGQHPQFHHPARWSAAAVARAKKVRALLDEGYTLEAIAKKVAD